MPETQFHKVELGINDESHNRLVELIERFVRPLADVTPAPLPKEAKRYYDELNTHWWGIERKAAGTLTFDALIAGGVFFIAKEVVDATSGVYLWLMIATVVLLIASIGMALYSFSYVGSTGFFWKTVFGTVRENQLIAPRLHAFLNDPTGQSFAVNEQLSNFASDTLRKLNWVFRSQSTAALAMLLLVIMLCLWGLEKKGLVDISGGQVQARTEAAESTGS